MVRAMCGVQLKDRKTHGWSKVWSTSHRQKDPWWGKVWSTDHRQKNPWLEQGVEYSSERSMVGARLGVQLIDIKIHGWSKMWSTAHRQKDPWWGQGGGGKACSS